MPPWPVVPDLHPAACSNDPSSVCLSIEEDKALSKYIHDTAEVKRALEACSLVTVVP